MPDTVNSSSAEFARRLLEEEIAGEIENYYSEAKSIFRLRRADTEIGGDTLDTEFFRNCVEVRQTPDDPTEVQILCCLSFRDDTDENLETINQIFGVKFDRVVSRIHGNSPDFDSVLGLLEDIEITHGGRLEESERKQKIVYYFPSNGRLEFDLLDGRVSICAMRKASSNVLVQSVQHLFPSNKLNDYWNAPCSTYLSGAVKSELLLNLQKSTASI